MNRIIPDAEAEAYFVQKFKELLQKRIDLEKAASEAGIRFHGSISDAKLAERIAEAQQ